MGEQKKSESEYKKIVEVVRTNFEGPVCLISEFANRFVERGYGTIVGISSIAGSRGRASNYVYGSAKAGFTAFLSGLRNRLFKHNVHVVTVLPGFVDTKMTEDMNLPSILVSKPKKLAKLIYASVQSKKDIVYSMFIWRIINIIILGIPEKVFKKLNF